MAQLSRPFQIALVAVVLLAGVWLFALQGHSSSPSASTTAAPPTPTVTVTTQPTTSAPAHHASGSAAAAHARSSGAAHKSASHTSAARSAPAGVHARHSTRHSPRAAKAKPAHAPTHAAHAGAAAQPSTRAAKPAAGSRSASAGSHSGASAKAAPHHGAASGAHAGSAAGALTAGQHAVEAELAKGQIVLLLFWNPHGTDDAILHQAVQQVRQAAHGGVAVHEASSAQVARFGSITRGVQVYATPTLFVINKRGQVIVLTGVQDAFAIDQAIAEARQATPGS
ncbi:MAG TPA: hypothetical protein VL979_11335 [Solirubrobacteraceae bacterium]|nr:hypothetical protein [Solirubrobacteraceae bacterium]